MQCEIKTVPVRRAAGNTHLHLGERRPDSRSAAPSRTSRWPGTRLGSVRMCFGTGLASTAAAAVALAAVVAVAAGCTPCAGVAARSGLDALETGQRCAA